MLSIISFILCIALCNPFIHAQNINGTVYYTFDNVTATDDYFIYKYDKDNVLTKEDVLKLEDVFYTSYYCKDDICVLTDNRYRRPFVEIPDKNGNVTLYNTHTCTSDAIKSNKCTKEKCSDYSCLSLQCTDDSECLSNKCFNNFCAFNEEEPIVHCDDIYTGKSHSYMYCGKPYGDTCKSKKDCSSQKCKNGICGLQLDAPSDSVDMDVILYIAIGLGVILLVILIVGCLCLWKIPKSRVYVVTVFVIFLIILIGFIIFRIFFA